jgi:hypothetical protein
VAPPTGAVSCTFVGTASGGQAPYTYQWTLTNPTNGVVVSTPGQRVSPALGCDVSTGVPTFNLSVRLTVTAANGATTSASGSQQIARAASACGT